MLAQSDGNVIAHNFKIIEFCIHMTSSVFLSVARWPNNLAVLVLDSVPTSADTCTRALNQTLCLQHGRGRWIYLSFYLHHDNFQMRSM